MPKRAILLVLVASVCAGCVSAGFVSTSEQSYPPHVGTVRVFWDSVPQEVQYEELGVVSSAGSESIKQWSRLVEALQAEAAKHGANAVIIRGSDEESVGAIVPAYGGGVYGLQGTTKNMVGTAIRITN